MMYEDVLMNTPFTQDILRMGREEGEELGMVKGLQLAIINMLQTRFPEITEQAKIKVTQVSNGEQLQHAIIDVTMARDASNFYASSIALSVSTGLRTRPIAHQSANMTRVRAMA